MTSPILSISRITAATLSEPPYQGQPAVIVRTGGCDSHCSWCSSKPDADPRFAAQWEELEVDDVVDGIVGASRGFDMRVLLTGGNPVLQPFEQVVERLRSVGYSFIMLETQGTWARPWLNLLDALTLSPKGPSSGETCDIGQLIRCKDSMSPDAQLIIKITVFTEADYDFARTVRHHFPSSQMFLIPGTPQYVNGLYENREAHMKALRREVASTARWISARLLRDQRYMPEWSTVAVVPQLTPFIFDE